MGDQIGSKRIVAGPRLNYYRATNGFRLEDTDLGKEKNLNLVASVVVCPLVAPLAF